MQKVADQQITFSVEGPMEANAERIDPQEADVFG
jgi:hypothetical protein